MASVGKWWKPLLLWVSIFHRHVVILWYYGCILAHQAHLFHRNWRCPGLSRHPPRWTSPAASPGPRSTSRPRSPGRWSALHRCCDPRSPRKRCGWDALASRWSRSKWWSANLICKGCGINFGIFFFWVFGFFFGFAVSIPFPRCHVVFWDFSLLFHWFSLVLNDFCLFLTVFSSVSRDLQYRKERR